MSLVDPKIDVLLDKCDNDRFLLCAEATKRANDLEKMMLDQHNRALRVDAAVELERANHNKPLSMAFNEIADGEVEINEETIDVKAH